MIKPLIKPSSRRFLAITGSYRPRAIVRVRLRRDSGCGDIAEQRYLRYRGKYGLPRPGVPTPNIRGKMSLRSPGWDTWHWSSNYPAHGARFSDCYLHEEIDSRQAITLLGVSRRQFWRLLAADRKSGAKSLPHGNCGRRPGNANSEDVAARVVELARDRYPDANHTHLVQLLEEREAIQISRRTLRLILALAGI